MNDQILTGQPDAAPAAPESAAPAPEQQATQTQQAPEPSVAPKPEGEAPAPVDYSGLQFGEGAQLNDSVLAEFTAIGQELGLSVEGAQKLIDLQGKLVAAQESAYQESMAAQSQQWVEQLKADKELGGQNFQATTETAAKAIAQYATPELRTFLNETGLGNHPELVKFCHRIGQAMAGDSIVHGGSVTHKEISLVDAFR